MPIQAFGDHGALLMPASTGAEKDCTNWSCGGRTHGLRQFRKLER
jgi:hypothetical protein